MNSYLYDVSFWIAVNIFLAAVVTSLVLIRYSMMRSTITAEKKNNGQDFSQEIMLFNKMVEQGDVTAAVVQTFITCFRKICEIAGVMSKTTTPKELLESGKLPKRVEQILSEMYSIYEPVRYGLVTPNAEELERFQRNLERLAIIVSGYG